MPSNKIMIHNYVFFVLKLLILCEEFPICENNVIYVSPEAVFLYILYLAF